LRRAVLLKNLRWILPGIGFGVFGLGLLFELGVTLPMFEQRERSASPLRHERGVVVGVMLESATRGNWMMREMVTVWVGRIEMRGEAQMPLHDGEEVEVSYRLAKSGRVYFEEVKPLAF